MGDSTKIGTIFQHPRQLPGKAKWGGYVYILLFKDGLLKVGFTANPAKRIDTHRGHSEGYGNPIVKGWLSPLHDNGIESEKELISRGTYWATSVNKSEYFAGIQFGRLVSFAQRLSFAPVDVAAHEAAFEEMLKNSPWRKPIEAARAAKESAERFVAQSAEDRLRDHIGSWFGRQNNGEYVFGKKETTRWPMDLVERLADARECSVEEVLDMNSIDLRRITIEAILQTEASLAYIHAVETGQLAVVRSIGQEMAEVAASEPGAA